MDLTMKWYNFLWEGLQTLLGCIVLLFLAGKKNGGLYKGRRIIRFKKGKFFSGTSLGYWILLPYDAGEKTTAHEWGHCVQSSRMGPLYLPVVGIPSLRNNLKSRYCTRTQENYYRLYPEADADRRGGIVWRDGYRVLT
jgi:hypothetical protein